MRDRRLQAVKAVIKREQCMATKGHDNGFLFNRQVGGFGFFRPRRQVLHRGPLFSFGGGLLIDAVALRKGSQAFLTILYCLTERLSRRGAPV